MLSCIFSPECVASKKEIVPEATVRSRGECAGRLLHRGLFSVKSGKMTIARQMIESVVQSDRDEERQ